ncbi:MAG: hypothetical protein D6679_13165 [Candidatus Hydrogenedentota bacterium]|nr:MAG: hypothetical protein D6679_13165 [Candidatus Hydrogenedentota bacterium]
MHSHAMQTRAREKRIPWICPQEVEVPEVWRRYLWDYPDGFAPLEKLLVRVLEHGDFTEISQLYSRYPKETFETANRYSVRRGVRYWLRRWNEGKD